MAKTRRAKKTKVKRKRTATKNKRKRRVGISHLNVSSVIGRAETM
jgi:hypothetical protein